MTTPVAFLFPGQGSQKVGMGADIFATSAAARHVFETVDEALGFSLSSLCFQGPEETLRETINAQPAIVTVSLALLAAFQEALAPSTSSLASPLAPTYTAGHSVGEYAALVAAGALDLKSAALLVRERGRLMHHEGTVCPGGMAAIIALQPEIVEEICQEATAEASSTLTEEERSKHPGMGKVIVANINAPGQLVISGEQHALQLAMEKARARKAKKIIPLAVSGAFHSPVMGPASTGLAQALATTLVNDATIPIISNISATPLTTATAIREELAQQISASVQWVRSMEYLAEQGVNIFIEIGPGDALTGMVKRIVKGATLLNISSAADIEKAVNSVRDMQLVRNIE